MKNQQKITFSLLVIQLIYLFPVNLGHQSLGDLPLMFWIVPLSGLLILLFQPEIDLEELQRPSPTDKYSAQLILLSGSLMQAIIVYLWVVKSPQLLMPINARFVTGFLLCMGGHIIRTRAIRVLKGAFTVQARILVDHVLVKDGIYSVVRHPSYTGAIFIFTGISLLLYNGVLLCSINFVVLIAVYAFRIHVEEKALIERFGEEYTEYMKRTWRLLPFLW